MTDGEWLEQDLKLFDGVESVTLRSADASAEVLIEHGLRRGVTAREAEASQGKYTQADAKWHLPAEETSFAPEVGMRLEDEAGTTWTILQVERLALGTRWTCWARDLVLVEGLAERVTIQRATWVKGDAGALHPEWEDWQVDLPARLQLQSASVQSEKQQRAGRARVKVFLAEQVLVDGNHRLVHQGQVYNVLGYEKPDRIDQLFVIEAERVPWPLS